GEGGDRGEGRRSGARHVDVARPRGDEVVLGNGDQLGPAAVVDARIGRGEKAENFVAGVVAADAVAHALDDAGEVAPERDGEVVLGHLLQDAGGDRGGGGVGR